MSPLTLVLRSLGFFWRTNVAVCLGVAAAVAVLGGALVTGDSVRGSLREIAVGRLGRTDMAVTSASYVREALAADLSARTGAPAAPIVMLGGGVTHEPSRRRASGVLVYGIDERFWRMHGLEPREGVFLSPALAQELGAREGDVLLTRIEKPSDVPLESLYAHKEDVGRTVRLTLTGVLARDHLGEFSLQPQQAAVRAVFAPLRRLQRDLAVPGRVNAVLLSGAPDERAAAAAVEDAVTLEDLGVKVTVSGGRTAVLVESASGVVSDALGRSARDAGRSLGLTPLPLFTYLANTLRVGSREVPYSLVTGIDLAASGLLAPSPGDVPGHPPRGGGATSGAAGADPIVLNEWTARELGASVGVPLVLEYYVWDPAAGLRTQQAAFTVAAIVPMSGIAADRRLAPEYPGITGTESLADWDPPFPLDLSRVRPQDEDYWDAHGSTPKAFVPYERARELWSSRYGSLTGLRFSLPAGADPDAQAAALRERLGDAVSPASEGLVVTPVRRLALESSTGATNFGEYFTYFSFFIVVSAVLLAMLFFRLGVEQRLRQIGILRATGYTTAHLRGLLLAEAAVVALAGTAIGLAGAVGYAHAMVFGLETWWVGAVGTTLLDVHVRPLSLAAGALGGMLSALACVFLSLRPVARQSPRALLGAYSIDQAAGTGGGAPRRRVASLILAVFGLLLIVLGFLARAAQAPAFFGAGAALLSACLLLMSAWLRDRPAGAIRGRGPWAVSRLGFRGAAFRPGRSVLSAALVASATFIIVSVDAFRRGGEDLSHDRTSGTGGYVLLAESEVPIVHNLNDAAARDALLATDPAIASARFTRFRLRPGDDASCLNLYRPENPTIIAPERGFIEERRFRFASSLAESDEEKANPWLLLRRTFEDGSVPVVADATSLQYVLHAGVGDTMTIEAGGAAPLTVRFVAALRDSVLQGQLVMEESRFLQLFPGYQGFRFFLVDAPRVTDPGAAAALAAVVERELEPFGVDAVTAAERLEAYHRVENTYLSTFQSLGALGLLLGTLGLSAVMFRNVLERRRELALLRAVGYDARHVTLMILAETALVVAAGVAAGALCALVAVAPAWLERGTAPGAGLLLLVAAVILAGLISAAAATRAAVGGAVLQALRAE